MVDWKIYIDSPQKRALNFCHGSLTGGDGYGDGGGYGYGAGDGYGYGRGNGDGYVETIVDTDGGSETEW